VVVTHAFVIAWVAAHVVGGPADAWLRMPVDNASITTVDGGHSDLLLRRFNSVHD
jgi:broad specificity phosphatase PhoE